MSGPASLLPTHAVRRGRSPSISPRDPGLDGFRHRDSIRGARRQRVHPRRRLERAVTTYCHINRVVKRMRQRTRLALRPVEKEAIKQLYNATPGLDNPSSIQQLLRNLGQSVSDQELTELLDNTCYKPSTHLTFERLCRLMEILKKKAHDAIVPDTVEAFAALGGRKDRMGEVDTDRLRREIERFELTIDIDAMIAEVDKDSSGMIDFEEFSAMFDDEGGDDMKPTHPVWPRQRSLPSFSQLLPGAADAHSRRKRQKRPSTRQRDRGGGSAQRKRQQLSDEGDSDTPPPQRLIREQDGQGLFGKRGVPTDPRELRRVLFDSQSVEERLTAMRVDKDTRRAHHHLNADRSAAAEDAQKAAQEPSPRKKRGRPAGPRGNVTFLGAHPAPPAGSSSSPAPRRGSTSRLTPRKPISVSMAQSVRGSPPPRRADADAAATTPAASLATGRGTADGSNMRRGGTGTGGGLRPASVPVSGGGLLSPGRSARTAYSGLKYAKPAPTQTWRNGAAPSDGGLQATVRLCRSSAAATSGARNVCVSVTPQLSQCARIALQGMDEVRQRGSGVESPRVLAGAQDPLLAAANRVQPRPAAPPADPDQRPPVGVLHGMPAWQLPTALPAIPPHMRGRSQTPSPVCE
eukprot:TRINITY_DN9270_c0_g1_i2.p1 TRINITY_DN9270_c0_g1~~TRINITY_DN9270_c0_g1_i2.p1  ORF type:complete len:632 (+),score=138.24 TRINITY_DN9270_c0_g1_i2:63-1958(+)